MKTKIIVVASATLLAFAAVKHHSSNKSCPLKDAFSKEVKK